MIRLLLTLLCLIATPLAAQEAQTRFGAENGTALLIRSTTDIAILAPAMEAFVARNPGVAIDYEQWGSNDLNALTAAECANQSPRADAVFSSAVHQMVELLNSGCAAPYRSAQTASLPAERIWRDELWGLTHEAAVIIYNTRLVPPEDIPHTRFDLLDLMRRQDKRYPGRIATYDIVASGLGYLFAFADSLEASTFGSLLEGFARSGAIATCCSAEIIEGVSSGRYLIAYNVLGSYVDSNRAVDVGVIRPSDYTLFLSRGYMIPKGAPHPALAGALLDFLLSAEGQAILTRSGLVTKRAPEETSLPESAERPIRIDPVLLVARDKQKREGFIARWRAAFGSPTLP